MIGLGVRIRDNQRVRRETHLCLAVTMMLVRGSVIGPVLVKHGRDLTAGLAELAVLAHSNEQYAHMFAEFEACFRLVGLSPYHFCCGSVLEYKPPIGLPFSRWRSSRNPATLFAGLLASKVSVPLEINDAIEEECLTPMIWCGFLRCEG